MHEEPLHLLREEQAIRDPGTYFASCASAAVHNYSPPCDRCARCVAGGAKLAIFARGFSPGLRRQAEEESVALVGIERLFG